VQAFSERTALPRFCGSSDRYFNRRITDDPPYQACSVQSAPTQAPTLVGAGRTRDAGRADVGLALNLCLSNQFL